MLRPDFALRQRVIWEKRLDEPGLRGPGFAPGVELGCRVSLKASLPPGGSAHACAGSILLPALCGVQAGDRITFEGKTYLLISVTSARDFSGRENHVEGVLA